MTISIYAARRDPRFWDKVSKRHPHECWPWTGSRTAAGYGVSSSIKRDGKNILAHRVSWEIHNGPIPPGLCICHHCDNPPCVNPAHLFCGTHGDNNRDMYAKGRNRNPRGEDAWHAKMSEEQAYWAKDADAPLSKIAERLGVSKVAIHYIKTGKNWRHLDD